jgi:hypothetical protein
LLLCRRRRRSAGAEVAARSPNDGHTLLLTSVSLAIGPRPILGGEIEMVVVTVPATIPFITTGRLRGIAVLALQRVPALVGVPTTAESGTAELVVITWYGLFVPAGGGPIPSCG